MNKLLHFYPRTQEINGVHFHITPFAILETPCYPCIYYFGPVHFDKGSARLDRTGEWITGDNATSNFHRTVDEALVEAKKMGLTT